MESRGEIAIFKSQDNTIHLETKLKEDTVWLTQKQMADLFDKNVRTINEHIHNIFIERELRKLSVIRKFRITAADGRAYETNFYNLDMIISVGYRVNSARATQFRIWATNILGQYLVSGYALNEKRLKEEAGKLHDLQKAIALIGDIRSKKQLDYTEAVGLLAVISDYNYALGLLDDYERIAASLFLWFLDNNGLLYREDGSKRLADNALVALTLMIAESKPAERDLIVALVVSLINGKN